MFYGGRLLSHLTTSEDALEDFINLRKLNRASAVIIDSDKNSSRANVNKTKRRIRDEFQSDKPAPGLAWITKCYTIENYIPDDLLKQAVEEVHPRTSYTPVGQWDNPLPSTSSGPTFDKVGIAEAVASMLKEKHLNRFDLRNRIQELADFVRASNGLTTRPQP